MSILNQYYLLELSKKYEIESIAMFENGFSSFCLSLNNKERIYLVLCNDYKSSFDINLVLDKISIMASTVNLGNSYLFIMPIENPTRDLCTYCNGKSFVHFIFLDRTTHDLVYDKHIYYSGCKQIKQLIDIYQNCFNMYRNSIDDLALMGQVFAEADLL